MKKYFFFLFLLGCFSQLLVAQTALHFQYTVLNNKNGLNTNNINDCIRDKRGFLWIATDFGLTRYSGLNSIHFSNDPNSGKPMGILTKLLVTDSIIYAAGTQGLYEIDTYTCAIRNVAINTEPTILDMVFYKDQIVLCSKQGELIYYNPTKKTIKSINMKFGVLLNLLAKGDDLFVLSLHRGCLLVDLKTRKLNKFILLTPFYYTDHLFLSRHKDVILCNKDEIRTYDPVKKDFIRSFNWKMVTAYKEIGDDYTFFIKDHHALYVSENGKTLQQLFPPVDKNTEFKKIKGDKNDDIYLISNQGVIIMRKFQPFTILNVFNDTLVHVRRAIYEDTLRKKQLFFAYDKIAIYDQVSQRFTSKPYEFTTHAVIEYANKLLLVTEASNLRDLDLSDFSFRKLYTHERPALQFIAVAKKGAHTFLLGTLDGLFQTNDPEKTIQKIPLQYHNVDYSSMPVKAIWTNKDQIWVGGAMGVLVLNHKFQVIDRYASSELGKRKLPTDEVNCFYATPSGLYIGLDGELAFIPFNGDSPVYYYTPIYGKSTNRIVSIVEDNFKDIWFATYKGVYRLNPNTGAIRSFHAPLYFSNDEFNRSSSLKATNGKLYFGNIAEYIEIDPAKYRDTIHPTIFQFNLARIYSNNKKELVRYDLTDSNTLELPSEGASLDLSYSLNDPVNAEQVSYQYRLVKYNEEWVDLGNRTSLQLFSLSAGEHHLQIRAIGNDGYASNLLNLTLIVPAVFYKTVWFNLLFIFIIISLVFSFYYIRVRNLRKILNFRKEISNELHDSVGTTVTKSIYTAQSLLQEKENDERVQRIIEYGRQINANFRDVLWSMERKTDAIINLFDRISEIGNQAVANTHFDFRLIKENISVDHPLTVRQKRDLLMITREAIHNALKHSNGNLITFHFSVKDKKLHLKISDNGRNENAEINYSGMGLESMKLRAQKMQATSICFKKYEQGFEIYLVI